MKILIVAATWAEIKPLENFLQQKDQEGKLAGHVVEICVTGIGGVATAFQLGKILPAVNWDLALQLGICGSFKSKFPIGSVVNVVEEIFADLGAEDGEIFHDAFEIGLMDADKFPFSNSVMKNETISKFKVDLPVAKGISVNKVHGNENSIQQVVRKYNADIESMEGAAFFYACKLTSTPFLQIRSVSNMVELRDKSRWNIPLAIATLNKKAEELLELLLTE